MKTEFWISQIFNRKSFNVCCNSKCFLFVLLNGERREKRVYCACACVCVRERGVLHFKFRNILEFSNLNFAEFDFRRLYCECKFSNIIYNWVHFGYFLVWIYSVWVVWFNLKRRITSRTVNMEQFMFTFNQIETFSNEFESKQKDLRNVQCSILINAQIIMK